MIKPKVLHLGDTIGLVAPASPTRDKHKIEQAALALINQGFQVTIGSSCYERSGYLSGNDEIRAEDINRMFKSPSIDGVFCLRGGYGSPRILDMLDYEMITAHPKIFIGYSDITAIHIALNQISGLVTFHGPMPASDMLCDWDNFSYNSYWNAITNAHPYADYTNPDGYELKSLFPGICKGALVGGNLTIIASTLGTPYEIDTKDKILFIEDIDESTYRIDRMLTQLRLSGKLKSCSGILLGNFNNCLPHNPDYDQSLEKVFQDILIPTKKPILSNIMAGHCVPKLTLPLGISLQLDSCNLRLHALEPAVHQ